MNVLVRGVQGVRRSLAFTVDSVPLWHECGTIGGGEAGTQHTSFRRITRVCGDSGYSARRFAVAGLMVGSTSTSVVARGHVAPRVCAQENPTATSRTAVRESEVGPSEAVT